MVGVGGTLSGGKRSNGGPPPLEIGLFLAWVTRRKRDEDQKDADEDAFLKEIGK